MKRAALYIRVSTVEETKTAKLLLLQDFSITLKNFS